MTNRVYIAAAGGLGLLAAAVFAASTVAATAGATPSSADVGCEIGAVKSAGGVALTGLAQAQRKLTLDYTLTIRAGGGGNSSDIVQSGQASVSPGQKAVLGTASLGGIGDYTATLTVNWPGGRVTCHRSGSA